MSPPPLNLQKTADDLVAAAVDAPSGRAARTLTAGGSPLRQTLMALRGGTTLAEHTAPGPATLSVIRGAVTLRCGSEAQSLRTGDWATVPTSVHSVDASEDAAVLLTVAPSPANPQA